MTVEDFLAEQWAEPNVRAAIVAVLLGAILEALRRWLFSPRGKLVWGISHQHMFIIPGTPLNIGVKTREIWLQNVGRDTITGVQIVLNFDPENYDIWPVVMHKEELITNDRRLITVDHLARREYVTISLFEARKGIEMPDVVSVRWDHGTAKEVTMAPQQVLPRWMAQTLWLFLGLGALSSIFIVVRLLMLISV